MPKVFHGAKVGLALESSFAGLRLHWEVHPEGHCPSGPAGRAFARVRRLKIA